MLGAGATNAGHEAQDRGSAAASSRRMCSHPKAQILLHGLGDSPHKSTPQESEMQGGGSSDCDECASPSESVVAGIRTPSSDQTQASRQTPRVLLPSSCPAGSAAATPRCGVFRAGCGGTLSPGLLPPPLVSPSTEDALFCNPLASSRAKTAVDHVIGRAQCRRSNCEQICSCGAWAVSTFSDSCRRAAAGLCSYPRCTFEVADC